MRIVGRHEGARVPLHRRRDRCLGCADHQRAQLDRADQHVARINDEDAVEVLREHVALSKGQQTFGDGITLFHADQFAGHQSADGVGAIAFFVLHPLPVGGLERRHDLINHIGRYPR